MTPYANHIAVIRRLLRASAFHRAEKVLHKIPPGDIDQVLQALGPADARPLCAYLVEDTRLSKTLRLIPSEQWSALLLPLSDGQIEGLFQKLPPGRVETMLAQLPESRRLALVGAEAQRPKQRPTAGALMGSHGIALQGGASASEAVQWIRQSENRDDIFYLYVTDSGERLVGVVPLRRLVTCEASTPLNQLMSPEPVSVRLETPADEAARILGERSLLALPVTDGKGRLNGVINADDLFEHLATPAEAPLSEPEPEVLAVDTPSRTSGWANWFGFFSPKRSRDGRTPNKTAVAGALMGFLGNLL